MCLCYSVLQVSFVFHCCMKQRTSKFEKAVSRQRKIYIMKKNYHVTLLNVASRIFRITCSSSRLMLSLLITNYIYDL